MMMYLLADFYNSNTIESIIVFIGVLWILYLFRVQSITSTGTQKMTLVEKSLPTPQKWPLLGHLHLLAGEPFIKMTELASKYGEIYFLQLGCRETVVLSSYRLIRHILVDRTGDFGDRCDFPRYHFLFGGDKENSLAFCNWSQVQKTRRALARRFCHSSVYSELTELALEKAAFSFCNQIRLMGKQERFPGDLKQIINQAAANAFFGFFCNETFENYKDERFGIIVRLFDDIFFEINQNHPTDILPWLTPFYKGYMKHLSKLGTSIREFVVSRIIEPHLQKLDTENPLDFVDILLTHLQEAQTELKLTMGQVLYELEDFLGGHSAVSNLIVRALFEITSVPGLTEKIYHECIKGKNPNYMQALIHETLRKCSSPIVPHVASVNTTIDGFPIKKGTIIMLNNYELNSSPKYWKDPEKFLPERFLSESGLFRKPEYFIPFSSGKRACMGYKLVEKITTDLLETLIDQFKITPANGIIYPKLPISCLAVHPLQEMPLQLEPRD